jgi:serine protease AprX
MKSILALLLFTTVSVYGYQAPLGKFLAPRFAAMTQNEKEVVLVTLRDKGDITKANQADARSLVSERSLRRRAAVKSSGRLVDESDYPLDQSYVQTIERLGVEIRHQLKWFNAVSVLATKEQISAMQKLSFVKEIEIVGRWAKRKNDEQPEPLTKNARAEEPQSTNSFSYGSSFTQNNQINTVAVHNLGIYGQGIVIGVFDNGFRNPHHQAFDSMKIIATHDFVDHKVSVVPNDPSTGTGAHGVMTLSTIGGYRSGSLIGPAFGASFILARTENDSSETPIEEDNWAAAIQWADSLGVDVTSTSLGYLGFDAPYTSLTWQDMNGHTALITNAADHAVALGIVVVNSAGNDGPGDGTHNTLIAPADGDSVITAGAVTSSGVRSSFSSVGPTTDVPARIKPDIMAMGSNVYVASPTDPTTYGYASGTSFSCPLSAGVAALIRCANPSLTPMQVREAMRQTASQSSTPDNYYGWGILNALSAINYYGILPQGTIRGVAFDDYNANGVRDNGEPGLAGVRIHCTGSIAESTLTDANGAFVFNSLPVDSFTITEVVPSNYTRSAPLSGNYKVTLPFKKDTSGFNFGNYAFSGAIHGLVFNDLNSNGVKDSNETGIPGRTIFLTGPMNLTTITDGSGLYGFTGLQSGPYSVRDSLPSGWAQISPAGNAPQTLFLRTNVDTTGIDFGVASLPAFTYSIASGWNLLSLPQDPGNHTVADLYPGAVSLAFAYQGTYQPLSSVPNGKGYWLRFPTAQTVTIGGTVRLHDTLALETNWNLIGSLSYPYAVTSIVDSGGIIVSNFFGFSTSYTITDSIRPNQGYWVKASAPGNISTNIILPPSAHHAPTVAQVPGTGKLTITDAAGSRQTLYFATAPTAPAIAERYSFPPLPPAGVFDARYENGSMLASLTGTWKTALQAISISSAAYPVTIGWKNSSVKSRALLLIDDKSVPLINSGSVILTHAPDRLAIELSPDEIPASYALGQNYPNPFNPATTIRYQTTAPGHVTLRLFDLTGGEIRTLVDRQQDAGYYSVQVDASNLPSGIYFYRLTAGSFREVKKMVLMK